MTFHESILEYRFPSTYQISCNSDIVALVASTDSPFKFALRLPTPLLFQKSMCCLFYITTLGENGCRFNFKTTSKASNPQPHIHVSQYYVYLTIKTNNSIATTISNKAFCIFFLLLNNSEP